MAPGFSFPPPPPPPPKAASANQDFASTSDSRGGSRGGRGGRGGGRGRGGAPSQGGHLPSNYLGSHMNNLPGGTYVNPAFQHNQDGYSRNTGADYGNKRKRDDYPTERSAGSWKAEQRQFQSSRPHPMAKPDNKPKVQVAPAVPSFGAPLFQAPPARGAVSNIASAPPQQPKTRLGLVPRGDEDDIVSSESEEDENLDEEAAFQAASTGPMTFEYNGEVAKLETQADIKIWIEERKKSWPSRRRVDEKQAEVQARMEERRRIEEETRAAAYGRHVNSQRQATQQTTHQIRSSDPANAGVDSLDTPTRLTETTGQTETTTNGDKEIAPVQQAGPGSDDDSAPEEVSSRVTPHIMAPPDVSGKICNVFAATGNCKFGKKCRYQHVRPTHAEATSRPGQDRKSDTFPKRKTLFDRVSISI